MEPSAGRGPDAVLFDMDGTLIDSEGLWLGAERLVMARLGGAWTPEDQAECLGGPLERVARHMVARAGSDRVPGEVGAELLDLMESRLRGSPLAWRPGARAFVDDARCRGLPTALVSASWGRLIDAVRAQIEAEVGGPAFDVVVAGDEVEQGMPHPEPYLTAAAALGVAPQRCLVLEDSDRGGLRRCRGVPGGGHRAPVHHRRPSGAGPGVPGRAHGGDALGRGVARPSTALP